VLVLSLLVVYQTWNCAPVARPSQCLTLLQYALKRSWMGVCPDFFCWWRRGPVAG